MQDISVGFSHPGTALVRNAIVYTLSVGQTIGFCGHAGETQWRG
jgi:hypothetical protein